MTVKELLKRCGSCRWYGAQPDFFATRMRHLCFREECSLTTREQPMEPVVPTIQAARASYGACGQDAFLHQPKERARAAG